MLHVDCVGRMISHHSLTGKYLFIFSDIAFYLQIQSSERSIIRPFVCFFVIPIEVTGLAC